MSLEDIIKTIGIDWTRTLISWDVRSPLSFDFEITPNDFLRYANQDFQNEHGRGIINAITNAKRAIDCQVDKFLANIGYRPNAELPQNVKGYIKYYSSLNKHADIPQRLQLIKALEIAPANMVSKIRRIRHLLEHQYKLPTNAQVAEAIELATLFIGTVNNVINSFVYNFYIFSEEPVQKGYLPRNYLEIKFEESHFEITGFVNYQEIGNIEVSKDENLYLELLRLHIAVSIGTNAGAAIYAVLQTIGCKIPQNMVEIKFTDVG